MHAEPSRQLYPGEAAEVVRHQERQEPVVKAPQSNLGQDVGRTKGDPVRKRCGLQHSVHGLELEALRAPLESGAW